MSVSLVNPLFIAFLIFCLVWLLYAAGYALIGLIQTLSGDYPLTVKFGYGFLFSLAFYLAVATSIIMWMWTCSLVSEL